MLRKLLPIFLIAVVIFVSAEKVGARTAYILKGVGWASVGNGAGIGWIKFNSAAEGSAPAGSVSYEVDIDDTGLFSGAAWAGAGYGWLSFNSADLTGCPTAPCEARVDLNTGNVSGWARFLTPKNDPSGAWDGWVSLSGVSQAASANSPMSRIAALLNKLPQPFKDLFNFIQAAGTPYGVNFNKNNGKFSGVAWGGDVAGWIAFGPPECANCTVRADSTNIVPVVSNVSIEAPSDLWCDATPFYRVHWDYGDGDGDAQVSATVRFVKVSDGSVGFTDTVSGLDASCTTNCVRRIDDPLSKLSVSTPYRVEIVSSDGKENSATASSVSTTTPSHYYPLVDFNWSPNPASVGSIETFTNNTSDRSSGGYDLGGPSWTFTNGNIVNSTKGSPTVIFRSLPSSATLAVPDSSGASCLLEQQITSSGAAGLKRRIFRER